MSKISPDKRPFHKIQLIKSNSLDNTVEPADLQDLMHSPESAWIGSKSNDGDYRAQCNSWSKVLCGLF